MEVPKESFAPNDSSEVADQKYLQWILAATSNQGLIKNHNTRDWHEISPSALCSQLGSLGITTATLSKENAYQGISKWVLAATSNQGLTQRHQV